MPEAGHGGGFGEEAVWTDVGKVAAVRDGPGETAKVSRVGFEDGHRIALSGKQVGCGQASSAPTDTENFFPRRLDQDERPRKRSASIVV